MAAIPPPPPESIKKVPTSIPKTAFASSYQSTFSADSTLSAILPLLAHVNCSYLSTPNEPVTLLNLKQHAQALTILIQNLSISTSSSAVETGTATFTASESFDWLNDLSTVYHNSEPAHNIPLTSIFNNLEPSTGETKFDRPVCPLHRVIDGPAQANALPFSSLQALTVHADQVLALLDHELSANGGLLSLLPFSGPEADAASRTILGQWINFTRALVSRAHELELAYGTCLDTLADEATIPRELTAMLGSGGRMPGPIQPIDEAQYQDRYVLANLSDQMWAHLGNEFNMAPAAVLDDGRGVTWLDIPTQYARLRGGKTVFIVPQWRQIEKRYPSKPTVVQVVKPEFRERASVWESRAQADLAIARHLGPENTMLKHRVETLEADVKVLEGGEDLQAQRLRFLRNLERQEEMRERIRKEERAKMIEEVKHEFEEIDRRTKDLEKEVKEKVDKELEPRVQAEAEKRASEMVKATKDEWQKTWEARYKSKEQLEMARKAVKSMGLSDGFE